MIPYSEYLDNIDNYRSELLEFLSTVNARYSYQKINVTFNGIKDFSYYRWLHPYQGDWEVKYLFTSDILTNLSKIIKPNSTVIDIGAQAGYMSVAYSQFAEKVISFEPNAAAFEILQLNSELNPNIHPYNLAISDEEGELVFHYSDVGLCNGGYAAKTERGVGNTGHIIPIEVIAVEINKFLDYIKCDDPISLIKIDAEGHDKTILRTLTPIVKKYKPVIITEIYNGLLENEVSELLDSISSLGYKAYDEKNNNLDIDNLGPEVKNLSDINIQSGHNLICVYDS